ncbi:transglutaminase TgpA family protein [Plantactinospora sp. WMMB334]|uniref:transglutaminase TgpA family protein n=1 Tax=Plantactinospora sp. WMMB334 TaxID=3404119 RepID=UPI003B930ECB
MRGRRHLGFVAAAATLLAAAPMSTIYDRWTWLVQCAVVVGLVAGAATLARWWRAPVWAQALAMATALLFGLTWIFPSGQELMALLPTPATLTHFASLLASSGEDMRAYGVPVEDLDSLLFLTALGVGGVAVVVDVLTVGMRRPALAGLPMLAIYSVPVAVHVDSVSAVPFVIGAAGFLWLLAADNVDRVRHFGRRFTGDGRDVDVWEPSPLAAAGRRLAVIGVAVAVLLPLAVPGMTSGLLSQFGSGGSGDGSGRPGAGGSPGRVNLFAQLSGELNRSEQRDMVKVTTNDPDPFYLRFAVADDFERTGFGPRSPEGTPVTQGLPVPRELSRSEDRGISRTQYEAQVEIVDFVMPFLPVYTAPVTTRGIDGNWRYDPTMQVVYSERASSRGRNYSFDFVRSEYTPAALAAAPTLAPEHAFRKLYTTVEPVREVEELVERLTAGKRNDYERVRAIYDHFSRKNGFSYALNTEGGTSGQDIVNFLTNKVGFCQQYAAAMTWLVREAGVPARVAFGFTSANRSGNTYTLTNNNLHAWTEVYFTGVGWVPFDATPAASVTGSVRSGWAPDPDAPEESATTPTTPGGQGADPSAGPESPDGSDRELDEAFDGGAGIAPAGGPRWPLWVLAGAVLLVLLLAVPALRRVLLRRRRQTRAAAAASTLASVAADGSAAPGVARVMLSDSELARARADAHAAWDELVDTLVDFRVTVDPAETPRATAERLAREDLSASNAEEAVRLLARAEERARYAREPLRHGPLGDALRSVRRALRAGADRRTRLVASTLPPSVLLRWRLAVMDASAGFVGLSGRFRERMLRFSPRRVLAGRPSR